MLVLKLFAIIAAWAYMVVATRPPRGGASTSNTAPSAPIECAEGEWYWEDKNVCLPEEMPPNPDPIPFGKQCPADWYWHQNHYCTPSLVVNRHNKCPSKDEWDHFRIWSYSPFTLIPLPHVRGLHEWYWKKRNICLLKGGPLKEHIVPIPDGYKCPNKQWYWHKIFQHCVPSDPWYSGFRCPEGYRFIKFRCQPRQPTKPRLSTTRAATAVPTPTAQAALNPCQEGEWYWKAARKCIPLGGRDAAPPARLGLACPEGWYWHPNQHCAPRLPENLGAPCPAGYGWNDGAFVCGPLSDSGL